MNEITILGYTNSHFYMIVDTILSSQLSTKIFIYDNQNRFDPFFEHDFKKFELIDNIKNKKNFVFGFAKPNGKYNFLNYYKIKKNNFTNLIHPLSSVSLFTQLGSGIRIEPLSSIANNTVIEDFVNINRNCSIGHDCIIGKYTSINPSVSIAGHVNIGERTEIGIGTNIINNIKIGSNVVIGAGSVVTKDIPDNVIAYGNPCKIIRENV